MIQLEYMESVRRTGIDTEQPLSYVGLKSKHSKVTTNIKGNKMGKLIDTIQLGRGLRGLISIWGKDVGTPVMGVVLETPLLIEFRLQNLNK